MRTHRSGICASLVVASLFVAGGQASAASIVLNGSLEDVNGTFVNTACQYMALGASSNAIADWTVSASTTGRIVWANGPTCDTYRASQGSFFVDLSGFGGESPNGAIQQQLATTINQNYVFSLDLSTANDGATSVTIGADVLALVAGAPFVVGTTSWTPYTAAFTASTSNPLLTVANASLGAGSIVFVDNVSMVADGPAPVPEPASAGLLAVGLAGLAARGWYRRRR